MRKKSASKVQIFFVSVRKKEIYLHNSEKRSTFAANF